MDDRLLAIVSSERVPSWLRRWAARQILAWIEWERYTRASYRVPECLPKLAEAAGLKVCDHCRSVIWPRKPHRECDFSLGRIRVPVGLSLVCSACGSATPLGYFCDQCGARLPLGRLLGRFLRKSIVHYIGGPEPAVA